MSTTSYPKAEHNSHKIFCVYPHQLAGDASKQQSYAMTAWQHTGCVLASAQIVQHHLLLRVCIPDKFLSSTHKDSLLKGERGKVLWVRRQTGYGYSQHRVQQEKLTLYSKRLREEVAGLRLSATTTDFQKHETFCTTTLPSARNAAKSHTKISLLPNKRFHVDFFRRNHAHGTANPTRSRQPAVFFRALRVTEKCSVRIIIVLHAKHKLEQ